MDPHIRNVISDFKAYNNAAAVTADIVAHSMGGDVARMIALEPWFASDDTYGHGPFDKLITIGTPHLGSPIAIDLLQGANQCVREILAGRGKVSLNTVTTSAGIINGAVGDLQGDGFGGSLSPALQQLFDAPQSPFVMARVSAIENGSNLNGLNYSVSEEYLYRICGSSQNDPLALDLTPSNWYNVFGQDSDAVVPILSQLNGRLPAHPGTLSGIIHSRGMLSLGFYGPVELDGGSGVSTVVINLLNEQPGGTDFQ